MMSLGTLLVKHGWISKQQLGLAISKQREIGGRLGTCLLEMGAIAEDLLNRSLLTGLLPVDALRGLGLLAMTQLGPLRRLVMREGVLPRIGAPELMRAAR